MSDPVIAFQQTAEILSPEGVKVTGRGSRSEHIIVSVNGGIGDA